MNKLAIIVPGQGMACSWAGGVLTALAKEHNLKEPDIAFASSGSAGVTSYYIAGQYDSILRIYTNFLSTKDFVNFKRIRKIIDIDYLIDTVFKKLELLDDKKIYSAKTEYLISATNFKTGEIDYLSNKKGVDIFEAMRATKAMPIMFGKRVEINGNLYCDTIMSSLKNLNILKAIEMGATHIIVIDSNNYSKRGRPIFNVWKFFRSKKFKKNYKIFWEKAKEKIEYGGIKMITIKPEKKLMVGTWSFSENLLKEAVDLGYKDCKNNKELKEFLKNFNNG